MKKYVIVLCCAVLLVARGVLAAEVDRTLVPAPGSNGLYGYIDAKRRTFVIAPEFREAFFFIDGVARVRLPGDKGMALLARDGTILLREYESIQPVPGEKEARPVYYDQGRGVLGRVFTVTHGERTGVFHADRGWLLKPEKVAAFRFFTATSFVYDGKLILDGKAVATPRGARAAWFDEKTGTVRLEAEGQWGEEKYGIMRRSGEVIVPAAYQDVRHDPASGTWTASRVLAGGRSLIALLLAGGDGDLDPGKDYIGVDVFIASGEKVRSFTSHQYPFVKNGVCTYTSKGRKHAVDARTGAPVTPETEQKAGGFAIFEENGMFGVRDDSGTPVVPAKYPALAYLGDEFFRVCAIPGVSYSNRCGVITATGREVLPMEYGSVTAERPKGFPAPVFVIRGKDAAGNTAHGLANREGAILVPPLFLNSFYFDDQGLAVVSRKGFKGVINGAGKFVIPMEYTTIFDTSRLDDTPEPYFIVEKGGLWGILDASGKTLLPPEYDYVRQYDKNNPTWFSITDKKKRTAGLFNSATRRVLPPEYTHLRPFGKILVAYNQRTPEKKEHYLLLTPEGKVLGEYDRVDASKNEPPVAIVRKNGKDGLVDASGKEIFPCRYTYISEKDPIFFLAGDRDGPAFYIDRGGKEYRAANK